MKDECGNKLCPWCGSHSNYCVAPGEAGDTCWSNFMRAANALLDGRCRDCVFFEDYDAVRDLGICLGTSHHIHGFSDRIVTIEVTPAFRCINYQPKEEPMPEANADLSETQEKLLQAAEKAERIPSESDRRTDNNVVRHEYRILNEDEKARMLLFKDLARAFIDQCDGCGTSRELSLAKTKAEEACMWAVKHITA